MLPVGVEIFFRDIFFHMNSPYRLVCDKDKYITESRFYAGFWMLFENSVLTRLYLAKLRI